MARESRTFDVSLIGGVVALVTMHLVGCSSDATSGASGKVTLDGKPLSEAVIMFVPLDAGRKKTGGEIIEGAYQVDREIGLLPGKYRVEIADNPPLGGAHDAQTKRPRPTARRVLPPRFLHDSPLAIEFAKGDTPVFDFELKSK